MASICDEVDARAQRRPMPIAVTCAAGPVVPLITAAEEAPPWSS